MSLSSELVGTWLLQSRIDVTTNGERHPDRGSVAAAPSSARSNTQAQGGYDAYFGTYSVDDANGKLA